MEKHILFNTEMVKAILEGRKTCTRRIIKRTPSNDESCGYGFWKEFNERDKRWYVKDYTHSCTWWTLEEYIRRFSKYQVGDILYVRETFRYVHIGEFDYMGECEWDEGVVEYKASQEEFEEKYGEFIGDYDEWKSSIHMPKKLARIFLKVTDVKIERLQNITEEEARKEGCIDFHDKIGDGKFEDVLEFDLTARDAFTELWDSTVNKKEIDKYSWEANPYVWVIEFERKIRNVHICN